MNPDDYRLQAAHAFTDVLVACRWCRDHADVARMDRLQRLCIPQVQSLRDLDGKADARGRMTVLITTIRSTIERIMAGSGWDPRPPDVAAAIEARGTPARA